MKMKSIWLLALAGGFMGVSAPAMAAVYVTNFNSIPLLQGEGEIRDGGFFAAGVASDEVTEFGEGAVAIFHTREWYGDVDDNADLSEPEVAPVSSQDLENINTEESDGDVGQTTDETAPEVAPDSSQDLETLNTED